MQARQRCVTDLFTSEMHKFLMWDALLGGQLARGTGAEKYFPFLDAFLDLGPWCGVAVTLLVQIRHATADFIAVQSLPGFIAMECNMSCGRAVKVHQAMFLYGTAQNKDILAQLHRLNNRQSWWGEGHRKSWGKSIKEHFATKLSRYLSDKGSLLNSVLHEEWIFKAKVQKSKEMMHMRSRLGRRV